MHQEDRAASREFHKILRDAIRACYRRNGCADLDDVCKEMERTASHTLDRLAPSFGRQYMRILAQHELKRSDMTNGHHKKKTSHRHTSRNAPAARRREPEPEQLEIPFENIEQWRGVPRSVSFEDRPGHVIYMPWEDLVKWQRHASLGLLRNSIRADEGRYLVQSKATDFQDSLTAIYGDLPNKELIRRWYAAGKPNVGGR